MNINALLRRKVAGVPVVYFAGLFVLILVFIAWRIKDASGNADTNDGASSGDGDVEGDVADGGGSGGDVQNPIFVAKPVPTAPGVDGVIVDSQDSNENWSRRAIEWLYGQNITTPARAQSAIDTYLSGADLSSSQSTLVDKAIRQFGLPPEPVGRGHTLADTSAAKRQGNPPTRHTVKGTKDNTFAKLARLYYNSDQYDAVNFLEVANLSTPKGTFAVGTQITVPKYHNPRYYVANARARTAAQIAAKNGTSAAAIFELNDSIRRELGVGVKIGTRVRVA